MLLFLALLVCVANAVDFNVVALNTSCGASELASLALGTDSVGDEAEDVAGECAEAILRAGNVCGGYFVAAAGACKCLKRGSTCTRTTTAGSQLNLLSLFDEEDMVNVGTDGLPQVTQTGAYDVDEDAAGFLFGTGGSGATLAPGTTHGCVCHQDAGLLMLRKSLSKTPATTVINNNHSTQTDWWKISVGFLAGIVSCLMFLKMVDCCQQSKRHKEAILLDDTRVSRV